MSHPPFSPGTAAKPDPGCACPNNGSVVLLLSKPPANDTTARTNNAECLRIETSSGRESATCVPLTSSVISRSTGRLRLLFRLLEKVIGECGREEVGQVHAREVGRCRPGGIQHRVALYRCRR